MTNPEDRSIDSLMMHILNVASGLMPGKRLEVELSSGWAVVWMEAGDGMSPLPILNPDEVHLPAAKEIATRNIQAMVLMMPGASDAAPLGAALNGE